MFRERPRRGERTPGILPPYEFDRRKASLRDPRLPRRVSRLLVSVMVSLTFLGLYSLLEFETGGWAPTNLPWQHRLPPLYPGFHLRELALPQHNLDLPYPEGKDGKYIWISQLVRGASHNTRIPCSLDNWFFGVCAFSIESGWGNALQEHFLNALVAYQSRRARVSLFSSFQEPNSCLRYQFRIR